MNTRIESPVSTEQTVAEYFAALTHLFNESRFMAIFAPAGKEKQAWAARNREIQREYDRERPSWSGSSVEAMIRDITASEQEAAMEIWEEQAFAEFAEYASLVIEGVA